MTDNEEAKEEPLAKRPKTESGKATAASKSTIDGEDVALLMSSILSPHILKDEAKYKSEYASATPYMHGRLVDMFADGFLKQVLEEVKQNTKVTFKESDLFRVYQSVDLGNIKDDDEIALKLPSLMKLKHVVYSKQFREFIERVIQLPRNTLIDHTDCAANCHAPGCHLLCHDDVIGTRKVSFIIYLTENDWTREEGGCLELYESEDSPSSSVPQAFPSKTILPTFNTMAFFEVKPGVSFHSVQEVYGERPRLSIQGWYHAKEAPLQIHDATLNQLKAVSANKGAEGAYTAANMWSDDAAEGDLTLSRADRLFLSDFINETYLKEESIHEIREAFEDMSSVQLRRFMLPRWADRIQSAAMKQDQSLGRGMPPSDYSTCATRNWTPVGPSHKQRFLQYVGNSGDNTDVGSALLEVQTALFQSSSFGRYLKCVTSLGIPKGHRGRIRRFRPGLDYTVAHYGILTKEPVLDATVCFCAGKGEQILVDEETGEASGSNEDVLWGSGDCGGFECYIAAADEKDEAAAEYDTEDGTELLSVSASNNTLSLVYRDPGTMRFIKYVGCRAPSSRWDISMEYQISDNGPEGQEDGDVGKGDQACENA